MVWFDKTRSLEERTKALVDAMNFTEKADVLYRSTKWINKWIGGFKGSKRLGLPEEVRYHDGPQGFRADSWIGGIGNSTAFPSVAAMATSFDRDLCREYGAAMGREFY